MNFKKEQIVKKGVITESRKIRIIGTFRFEYEYEIEYEYDFSNPVGLL